MNINILLFLLIVFLLSSSNIQESFQNKYKYGIVLCCYNRPKYLKRTLTSLSKSNLHNSILCIIDDYSKDIQTIQLIDDFKLSGVKIIKYRNTRNIGIQGSLMKGFDLLYARCTYLLNIDSDVIMKKNWLQQLDSTYLNYQSIFRKNCILTGFNCTSTCQHYIIKEYDRFYVKKSIGGINMYFTSKLYINYIRTILLRSKKNYGWDWKVVRFANSHNIHLISTKPSVIQHIGTHGLNSKGRLDIAEDY